MKVMAYKRGEKDLTQWELGEMVGVHQAVISQIENGIVGPNPELLGKLAAILEVDPEKLLEDIKVDV